MGFKHEVIEKNALLLAILVVPTVAIGGLVEIVPLFTVETTIEKVEGVRPYTPLELAGRNVYVREGCYLCHSQQVRPFRDEVERYGHYSIAAESKFDKPFQWGSKRTGPDLARVGGKYSNAWHVAHLENPQAIVPGSVMPAYAFLAQRELNFVDPAGHLTANKRAGVPYTEDQIAQAEKDLKDQANPEADTAALLKRYPKAVTGDFDGDPAKLTEMDALVAYLQMLGTLVDFNALTLKDLQQ